MKLDLSENLQLAKIPSKVELALYLIQTEFRNKKLSEKLEQIGFDASFYSFDFGALILNLTGFEMRTDELYEWYNKLLEGYIGRLDQVANKNESIHEHAFNFYLDLEVEKRLRERGN